MVKDGNTADISLRELILGLSGTKFSGNLTLNKGEHFCVIQFREGDVVGAYGWKFEGSDAIIHLFLENKYFSFSLPGYIELKKVNTKEIPNGARRILNLIDKIENEYGKLCGNLYKKIAINDNVDSEIEITADEFKQLSRFIDPMPLEHIIENSIEKNISVISKFLKKNLITFIE